MAKPSEVSVNLQELEREEDREKRSREFGFETNNIILRYVEQAAVYHTRILG